LELVWENKVHVLRIYLRSCRIENTRSVPTPNDGDQVFRREKPRTRPATVALASDEMH
jgi:hypothetical protein